MLRCCKPRSFNEDGDPIGGMTKHEWRASMRMHPRCRGRRFVDRKLPRLSINERRAWGVTEAMNERGISVDRALLQRVLLLVKDAQI